MRISKLLTAFLYLLGVSLMIYGNPSWTAEPSNSSIHGVKICEEAIVSPLRAAQIRDAKAAENFVSQLRTKLTSGTLETQKIKITQSIYGREYYLEYEGIKIGSMRVTDLYDLEGAAIIESVGISWDDKFKGRGLGTLLYVVAARHLYENEGLVLHSASDLSPDARRMWNQFRIRNVAVESGDPSYRSKLKPSFLRSAYLRNLRRQFLDSRAKRE